MSKICQHCKQGKVSRPRQLCWHCYYAPGVKELYYACPPSECGAGRKKGTPRPCQDCGEVRQIYGQERCKTCYTKARECTRIHCRLCQAVWGGPGYCPECRQVMAYPGTRGDCVHDPDPKGRAERVEYYAALVAAGIRLFEPTPAEEDAA